MLITIQANSVLKPKIPFAIYDQITVNKKYLRVETNGGSSLKKKSIVRCVEITSTCNLNNIKCD